MIKLIAGFRVFDFCGSKLQDVFCVSVKGEMFVPETGTARTHLWAKYKVLPVRACIKIVSPFARIPLIIKCYSKYKI
jgi:hypothetical protein